MTTQSRSPSKEIQKRISKRGAITDADVQDYINQVGLANISDMSMNDVEQYLKNFIELGQRQKKLPSKKKIEPTDSIVVSDKRDDLAKVKLEDQNKSGGEDKQGFKSFSDLMISTGVFSVKRMFPTFGRLIDTFEKKNRKNEQDLEDVNDSNKENAQQVSRSSILLSKIAETQLKTNELLEKIIDAAANPRITTPTAAPGDGNPNVDVDLDRRRRSAPSAPAPAATRQPQQSGMGSAARYGIAAIGAAAVAGGAYAAYRGLSGGDGATSQATPVRAESGRFNMRGEEGQLTATYSRTAEGRHTIDEREVDAETYNRFRQLTEIRTLASDRELQQDPRFQQYVQQAAANDDLSPELTARQRIQDEDRNSRNRELFALMERIRSQPVGQRRAGAPTATNAQGTPTAQRQESASTGAGVDARILNVKAREIVFKADSFEFDRPNAVSGVTAGAPPPVASTSAIAGGSPGAPASGSSDQGQAAATGSPDQIQNVVQKITQEFPAINVTSTSRPGSGTSQHATGNAVDLSLRGLSQDQRASLVQNLTAGKYGNVGGLGTYNATGDLLHVDTRSGPKMAWGPNRSRTSLNETPQWFQQSVTAWMGGGSQAQAAGAAMQEQEPRPGGEQAAPPAATPELSTPSSGAAVAQASVRSETSMMQQQAPTKVPGAAEPAPPPSGSVEQTATTIDPNEPGPVEPPDAAQRYARLFNLAA